MFIESKASPNEWRILFGWGLAWTLGRSIDLDRVESFSLSKEEYARYGLRSGSSGNQPGTSNSDQQLGGMAEWLKALVC